MKLDLTYDQLCELHDVCLQAECFNIRYAETWSHKLEDLLRIFKAN